MRRAVKRYTVLLEFLIALGILPGCVWSVPTIRVSGLAGEPTRETGKTFSLRFRLFRGAYRQIRCTLHAVLGRLAIAERHAELHPNQLLGQIPYSHGAPFD
jgi:hypothetical protein